MGVQDCLPYSQADNAGSRAGKFGPAGDGMIPCRRYLSGWARQPLAMIDAVSLRRR